MSEAHGPAEPATGPPAAPSIPRALAWLAFIAVGGLLLALIPIVFGQLSRPGPNGSLLDDGTLYATNALGIPRHTVQGPLAVEGSNWLANDRGLVLGRGDGALVIDTGKPAKIGAVALQATHDGRFEVDVSSDGEHWRTVWTVERSAEGTGVITRGELFSPALDARWLRVRSVGIGSLAAISGVRAYGARPDAWPPRGPDHATRVSDYPWFTLAAVIRAKAALGLLGAILLCLHVIVQRRDRTAPVLVWLKRAIIVVSLIAAAGWWNFFQISDEDYEQTYMGYHDVYHYYLGAKFAPELGYSNLYHCTLIADDEAGLRSAHLRGRVIRELENDRYRPVNRAITEADRCKQHFTDARWAAFNTDLDWFRSALPASAYLMLIKDHGYNPTPVWSVTGGLFTLDRPASDAGIFWVTLLDPTILFAIWVMVWTTFGWRPACAGLLLWGTSFATGNWFIEGAFLRCAWLLFTVGGVCLLARGRMFAAGGLLSYATALRIFPGFLVGGVALAAIVELARTRTILPSPAIRRFAAGVAAVAVLALGASLAQFGGIGPWADFVQNAIKHKSVSSNQDLSLETFARLFTADSKPTRERVGPASEGNAPSPALPTAVRLGIAALVLVLLAFAVSGEAPWIAAILGFCWLPFATGVSNYYYIGALLLPLLSLRFDWLLIPFAVLAAAWALAGLFFSYSDPSLFGFASGLLLAFSLLAIGAFAFGKRLRASSAPGD